jgi:hypothetical protein
MGLSMGGWVGQQVAAAAAAANLNLNSNLNASADGGGRGTVDATIMGNSDTAPGAWGGEMHAEWQTRGGTAGENGEDVLAANPASPSSDAGGGGKQAAAMAQTACSTLVKGLLRSLWKEGVVSRDVFKTICKKVRTSPMPSAPASELGRAHLRRWLRLSPAPSRHGSCNGVQHYSCTSLPLKAVSPDVAYAAL